MFDLIIRGGTVVGPEGRARADVAVAGGRVAALGEGLGAAAREIDAAGRLVLPGGVDSHCHIEQMSGAGIMNADSFESATRAAALGGTTTTISFAAQPRGTRLRDAMSAYAALAARGAVIDHAFHAIVADAAAPNLAEDLPALIAAGHRSIKVFTTYPAVRLGDAEILDVLWAARAGGALVCAHAENDGMIEWSARMLRAAGRGEPAAHAAAHHRLAEIDALERIARLAELTGQPVMLFHVSTAEGAAIVRAARGRGAPVRAETCPHYLLLTEAALHGPRQQAAGALCSPPLRAEADQDALWRALALGDLQLVTSDHAPYRLDASGKFAHGADAPFERIASGVPGLRARLPVMFDACARRGVPAEDFVRWTSTAPAAIFGLTGKGCLAPGADADVTIWDPARRVTLDAEGEGGAGYTPYAGRQVTGWPETVLSRGEVIVEGGALTEGARAGRGRRVPMAPSPAMRAVPPALGSAGR